MTATLLERTKTSPPMTELEAIRAWARAEAASAPALSAQQSLRLRGLFLGGGGHK
jgi:hypothetical protein